MRIKVEKKLELKKLFKRALTHVHAQIGYSCRHFSSTHQLTYLSKKISPVSYQVIQQLSEDFSHFFFT
jgi:hypothetical protein